MGDILQECIETAADPTEQKVTSKTSADPPAPQRDAIPVPWLSTHDAVHILQAWERLPQSLMELKLQRPQCTL